MNLFGYLGGRPAARPAPAVADAEAKDGRARLLRHSGWAGSGFAAAPHIPGGYAERVHAAFVSNPIAQRAARIVADAVAGAPISGPPQLLTLLSARSAAQPLLETVALHLQLHGNAYVQVLPGAGDAPAELYALRPERLTIELDGQGWPHAYAYRVGGQAQRLPRCDASGRTMIIHIRATNPVDDHYGVGALSAAIQAVALHNSALRWNHALLDNAARPSGAIIYDPGEGGGTLSAAQFDRLRDELAAQFQGSSNAGRPMLLEGGLKWQSLSLSPAEMDFRSLKDSAARDIAMAFGVPPMLIGITGDATYANYREASKALWRQTILPMLGTILTSIDQALATWSGQPTPGQELRVILDQIPALSEDRERLWAQVSAADFLSEGEKRSLLHIAPRADEEQR